ncbi:hypothetical protein PENTCL1PPCAC_22921 [Pristionchus entomophagus]|uniref:Uncharacterized protein n=1 Tax=Pristionchus entomophagus TaxID=358040 RepID=A0AAV5U2T3_9BILA|nr:hypothetical protein PENTCL1PPCAC_22921 [Pristionchus entomophagus]
MSRIASIGIFLLFLLSVQCELKKRHHRRSISYDDRWFGFHFDNEPESSTFKGKLTIIPCTYSLARKRESVVEWRRDSTPLITSDKRISILSNGSLSLSDASRSDEGVYQCAVHITDHQGSQWTFLSNKALMRVRSTLRWKEEPKDTTIQGGRNGVLRCELEEMEGATIRWIKDGREINNSSGIWMNGVTGTLEIGEMNRENQGLYSCIAHREKDKIESSRATISMKRGNEPMELHLVSRPVSRRVKEGEEIGLECIPSGDGEMRVEWMKDGVKIEGDHKIIQKMGRLLHFPSLRLDHSGSYTCRVNDATDSIESSATLTVLAAPRITSRPQDIVAVETTDVELECFSSGRPSPTLSWFKNGEMLIPSEYFVIEANKLRILGLVKTDQGIYECFVENEGGTAHAAAQLLVDNTDSSLIAAHSGTPVKVSAPLGLGVTVIGSREATLTWDAPIHRNGNILHYHLFYKEEGSDRERVVNSTERVGRVRDLHPSTTYLMRVAGENEAGIGDISLPITLTTKEEQEVPGRVVNLRAMGVGSETIEVEWGKPSNGGATPAFYRLFYVRSEKKDVEKETQINVPSTAYTMHGMDKFTSYDIRVEAEGEKGAGLSSNTVTVRTLSDLPSMAPIDINARPLSTTSVKVTWKVEESQSNGPIIGARMKMKMKARGSKASNIVIDGARMEETVEGLDAGTAYQLRIALVNENGTGPYSDWVSVDTPLTEKDESVLGAPRDLSARATSDSISLRWRPPADESVLVRGYQVGWGLNVPDVESSRVDGDILEWKINGLKPSRDYVISVRAWNRQGSGFPIYETVRTSATGVSSWPMEEGMGGGRDDISVMESPLGVQAIALSPTSIRLSWAENPSLFNVLYNVKYMSKVDSGQSRFLNTSETSIVVDKLKPGTEYEMGVRAMAPPSALSPWSMTVSQLTLPAPPSSSPRDVTILPAASGDPHAVTVNWQPPKYANGELIEYTVSYTDRASAREEEWTSIRVPADRLSLPIDNLLPKSNYYFRIQAKNVKGVGPMSPTLTYSPGSAGFVHPPNAPIGTSNKGFVAQALNWLNGLTLLSTVVVMMIGILVILLFCLVCVCAVKKMSTKPSPSVYGGGRKSSNGINRNNDLWIQHGVGGASSHLLTQTPSINDIKNRRGGGESPPPRYHTGTIHRAEDAYACVGGGHRGCLRPFESESSVDSSRPLLSSRLPHKSHPHMVQVAPPAPGSSTGDSERSGTLSRSYQHSSTSLDQRQRTPQMVYGVHGRGMGKVDMGESPYGSSIGLGSGTPPPPNLAPPHPPIVTADGYRSVRGPTSIANMPPGGLRSFSNMNGGLSTVRQIPVGRAQAQPRINVANLCSPYLSSSAMSMEEDKMGLKEEERSNLSHLTLHPSLSNEDLGELDQGDVDHMISDLQALQQEFGVNS